MIINQATSGHQGLVSKLAKMTVITTTGRGISFYILWGKILLILKFYCIGTTSERYAVAGNSQHLFPFLNYYIIFVIYF